MSLDPNKSLYPGSKFRLICAVSLGLMLGGVSCAWASDDQAAVVARDAYNRGDYRTAFEVWEPLAREGSPSAQFSLGRLFAAGLGVPQDFGRSFQWYMKAASQNDAEAQQMVGVMYGAGLGVRQNPVDAYMWLLLSLRRGNIRSGGVSSQDLLRDLEEVMAQQGNLITQDQRDEARVRATVWRPVFR